MSKLAALQQAFQAYLLSQSTSIEQQIVSTEAVSAATRLGVYHFAYGARLMDALASNYPVLQAYLGEEAFAELAKTYLAEHPSTTRNIRWFGDKLSVVLRDQYPDQPYLAELAAVEWTMTLVFDAADAETVTVERLSGIPPEAWSDLVFAFHPSVKLLELSWTVMPCWRAITEDQEPELPVQMSPVTWIYWRQQLNLMQNQLAEDEAWALRTMLAGETFGVMCEGLCRWSSESDAVMRAASLMKGWILAGLISKIG